jgi:hypothetical protein
VSRISGHRGPRFDEHARAFWLPVLGVGAVLLLVWWAPAGKETSVAITAIVTLTAGAAGHAAGTAAAKRGRTDDGALADPGSESEGLGS